MMKEKVFQAIGVVSVLSLLVFGITAWTQDATTGEAAGTGRISVTGEAEIRVVPDEVILTLGVETWNKDMEIAKGQNDTIVARVFALADEYAIAPEHVQTDYVSIEPRYRNGYYEERDFIGYFVHKTVVITLRDLNKFEDLLADALEAGVNYVHGIQFRTTELRAHRDEARALAIRAAKEKAEALAGELDQVVGNPTMIQELQNSWWSGYNSWWGANWGNGMTQNVIQEMGTGVLTGDGSLAPGQISITARVSVTFGLTD
jgi:uncharacterized protein YggE